MSNKGGVIMPDGSRMSCRKAAVYLDMSENEVRALARAGNKRWAELVQIREDRGGYSVTWADKTLARLDPREVHELGSYSRGQSDHWDILTELLGLDKAYAGKVREHFPDA